MMSTEDPRVVRSRERIIESARSVFLAEGYRSTTLAQVAESAGVAKRTIYNLYADKETLFRATILSVIGIADAFASELADGFDRMPAPHLHLPELAERLALATLLGPALTLRRLLIMESATFPDLVREYRARAPEAVMRALSTLFSRLADSGQLHVADADLAAEHFAFLAMGADLDRAMFEPTMLDRSAIVERARAGGEVFVRAYLPRR